MKISGRTIAYLLVLVAVILLGGISLTGAQGFPPVNPLPVPVEESGIVEIVRINQTIVYQTSECPRMTVDYQQVPTGKRLIIEHATAATSDNNSATTGRSQSPSWIRLYAFGDNPITRMTHDIAYSKEGFPVSGGGPITFYAEPGERVGFQVICPIGTKIGGIGVTASFTGRLVPHLHPSTIPTATPPP